jgi:hypothetical protein
MKRALSMFGLLAALIATLSLGSATLAKDMTYTGWISDSMCGAKGANAAHKDCALKCVKEKGAKYVFVDSKTKKVMAIENQDAVSEANLGQEVKVTGSKTSNGELHVASIANASPSM